MTLGHAGSRARVGSNVYRVNEMLTSGTSTRPLTKLKLTLAAE